MDEEKKWMLMTYYCPTHGNSGLVKPIQLEKKEIGSSDEIQLTDALANRIGKVPLTGFRFSGERFDCGSKLGFLQANIAFALQREDLAVGLKPWILKHSKLS